MSNYSQLPVERRRQFIFRGHADRRWKLETTLDRRQQFKTAVERESRISDLIREFQRESSGLRLPYEIPVGTADWELLGRHHGLATPILDWTASPAVAAFFAFHDAGDPDASEVAIWALDREWFRNHDSADEVEIIDDEQAIRLNPRAIEQRAVFLRVRSTGRPLEQILDAGLTCFVIPVSERRAALAMLDEMMVNARILFRDLDAAANSANIRVLVFGDEP